MKNPYRVGSVVYLRPLEPEDARKTVSWINDPAVSRTVTIWRPMTVADEVAFFERGRQPDNLALGIALVADDRLVGVTGFHRIDPKDRHASFGIAIGNPSDWDKGYGSQATRLMLDLAFDTMNLNRVMLHVYAMNKRGIHAYEKLGFRHEGVLRRHHFVEGEYHDTMVMGILAEEWKAAGASGETAYSSSE